MIRNINSIRRYINFSLSSIIIFGLTTVSVYGQEMPKMNMDSSVVKQKNMKSMDKVMLPMPFFTHMGVPYSVGTYGLRIAALETQNEGKSISQFNFQFETGLSKTVGLFIGGEGLFDDPTRSLL